MQRRSGETIPDVIWPPFMSQGKLAFTNGFSGMHMSVRFRIIASRAGEGSGVVAGAVVVVLSAPAIFSEEQ